MAWSSELALGRSCSPGVVWAAERIANQRIARRCCPVSPVRSRCVTAVAGIVSPRKLSRRVGKTARPRTVQSERVLRGHALPARRCAPRLATRHPAPPPPDLARPRVSSQRLPAPSSARRAPVATGDPAPEPGLTHAATWRASRNVDHRRATSAHTLICRRSRARTSQRWCGQRIGGQPSSLLLAVLHESCWVRSLSRTSKAASRMAPLHEAPRTTGWRWTCM